MQACSIAGRPPCPRAAHAWPCLPPRPRCNAERKSKRARKGRAPIRVDSATPLDTFKALIWEALGVHPLNAQLFLRWASWRLPAPLEPGWQHRCCLLINLQCATHHSATRRGSEPTGCIEPASLAGSQLTGPMCSGWLCVLCRGAPVTQDGSATLAACEVFPGDEVKVVSAWGGGGLAASSGAAAAVPPLHATTLAGGLGRSRRWFTGAGLGVPCSTAQRWRDC